MGTWGHGLFDDDFALDVREEYLRRLLDGLSSEAATAEMISSFVGDADEEPVFWLSLAATQHEHGRLDPRVKEGALGVIDGGSDRTRWGDHAGRRQELAKLRKRLTGRQPKPKRIAKTRAVRLEPGDFFRLPLTDAFAFGRILTPDYWAFYAFASASRDVSLDDLRKRPVAFVVTCHDQPFRSGRWRVIGNAPLEPVLEEPRYFFHQAVGSATCLVFDMWAPERTRELPAADCDAFDRWGAFAERHVVDRLEAILAGHPDPWTLQSGARR